MESDVNEVDLKTVDFHEQLMKVIAETILENKDLEFVCEEGALKLVNTRNVKLTKLEISVEDQGDNWVIEFPTEDVNTRTTIHEQPFIVPKNDWEKVAVHDFTFQIFGRDSDKNLTTIHPEADNCSPDYYFYENGHHVFVEVATTMSHKPENSFIEKVEKYSGPLKRLARLTNESVILYVIVASHHGIYTNFDLGLFFKDVDIRYRVSQMVSSELVSKGAMRTEFDAQSMRLIEGDLLAMSVNWSDKPFGISEKDYNDWMAKSYDIDTKVIEEMLKKNYKSVIPDTSEKSLNDYIRTIHESKTRDHKKSVYPFPVFDPPLRSENDDLSFSYNTLMGRVWSQVWNKSHEIPFDLFEPPKPQEDANERRKGKRIGRSDHLRENTQLREDDKIELAKRGICGKKYKDHERVKDHRENQKIGLSWDTSTESIDEDLLDSTWWTEESDFKELNSDIHKLLMESLKFHASKDLFPEELIKKVTKMKGFVYSLLMSTIAIELIISMQQHCNDRQFIMKKVGLFNVYLLIKPTNSSGHIFVSLLVPEMDGEIMRSSRHFELVTDGDVPGYATEFISFDCEKLNHLSKAAPLFIATYAHVHATYGEPIQTKCPETFEENEITRTHLAFLMTCFLENKQKTEEIITQYRYIFMQLTSYVNCQPWEIFSRYPTVIRSRLQLWCLKRIIQAVKIMLLHRPTQRRNDSDPDHAWQFDNLIDWITMKGVPRFSQVLETFYYGYFVNKDAVVWKNSTLVWLNPIIENERTFLKCSAESFGNGKGEPHSYSDDYILQLSNHAHRLFSETIGPNYKETMFNSIVRSLAETTFEQTATTKSSFVIPKVKIYDPNSYVEERKEARVWEDQEQKLEAMTPEEIKRSKETDFVTKHTSKVIVETIKVLEKETVRFPMMSNLSRWMREKNVEGIYVKGDPKAQVGTPRGTTTMDVKTRYVQLAAEKVGRVLCSHMPNETMQRPAMKEGIEIFHRNRVQIKKDSYSVTLYNSLDKSKWNHTLSVKAMMLHQIRVTDKRLHPFLINICNLWLKKHFLIPEHLLKLMTEGKDENIDNENYLFLKESFINGTGICSSPYSLFMEVQSGMFQGLLHFTSSFLHACHTDYMCRVYEEMLNTADSSYIFTISSKVSSDDSSYIVTISGPDQDFLTFFTSRVCANIDNLCIFASMQQSKKGTMGSPINEFNSVFKVENTTSMPTSKFVIAALAKHIQAELIGRQEEKYSLKQAALESGCSFLQVCIIEYAQGLQHYLSLGFGTNRHFKNMARIMMSNPNPNQGFFLLDEPLCSGLMGFDYLMWNWVRSSIPVNRYMKSSLKPGSIEVNIWGKLVMSAVIQFGSREKYLRVLSRLKIGKDSIEEFKKNARLAWFRPTNIDEELLRIKAKILSPGMSDAFSTSKSQSKALSSCAYVCQDNIVSTHGGILKRTSINTGKSNLIRKLLEYPGEDHLSEEELLFLFPLSLVYAEQRIVFNKIMRRETITVWKFAKKRQVVINLTNTPKSTIGLNEKCFLQGWFGKGSRNISKSQLERRFRILTDVFKWIKTSPHDTLANTDFENHLQLRNYICRSTDKVRILHVNGTLKHANVGNQVTHFIRRNYWPGLLWKDLYPEKLALGATPDPGDLNYQLLRCALSDLFLVSIFPCDKDEWLAEVHRICDGLRTKVLLHDQENKEIHLRFFNDTFLSKLRPRELTLALMIKFDIASDIDIIYDDITKWKTGMIGTWTLRQKFKDGKWGGRGVWQGTIAFCPIKIEISDKHIVTIQVRDLNSLQVNQSYIIDFAQEAGLEFASTHCKGVHFTQLGLGKGIGSGCPVFVIRDIQYDMNVQDTYYFSLEPDKKIRQLRFKMKIIPRVSDKPKFFKHQIDSSDEDEESPYYKEKIKREGHMTLLSLKAKSGDIYPIETGRRNSEMLDYWSSMTPAPVGCVDLSFSSIKRNNLEEARLFMKTVLEGSMESDSAVFNSETVIEKESESDYIPTEEAQKFKMMILDVGPMKNAKIFESYFETINAEETSNWADEMESVDMYNEIISEAVKGNFPPQIAEIIEYKTALRDRKEHAPQSDIEKIARTHPIFFKYIIARKENIKSIMLGLPLDCPSTADYDLAHILMKEIVEKKRLIPRIKF